MRWVDVAAAVILAIASPAGSAMARAPDAELARAEQAGRLIFALDQAAWHATDEMIRQGVRPRAGGGWIVEPIEGLLRVTFYSGEREAYFRADMRGDQVAASLAPASPEDRRLNARQERMARARQAAMALNKDRCTTGAFNTVVVPSASDDGSTTVYLLSSMVTSRVFPTGGHHRVDVGPDGQVTGQRPFTNGCLNMDFREAPPGAIPGVTHTLDPTPTEIHAYLSLWMGRPLMVATEGQTWIVDKAKVRRAR